MIEKEYQYIETITREFYRENKLDEYRDDVMLPKLNKHLKDADETYFEHMYHALGYTLTFALLTVTTLIHAILPFTFVATGSKKISELHEHITSRLDNSINKDA
tara:strand:- start:847 stop:1158 length:312 start_codon:yes stop_codon:yes gene_type:complete